jgi:hypothetical protein
MCKTKFYNMHISTIYKKAFSTTASQQEDTSHHIKAQKYSNLQFLESSKLWPVSAYHVLPSVGKNNRTFLFWKNKCIYKNGLGKAHLAQLFLSH